MTECRIHRGQSEYTYSLPIPVDGIDGEVEVVPICGNCWEAIAEISQRANIARIDGLEQRIAKLEEQTERIIDSFVDATKIIKTLMENQEMLHNDQRDIWKAIKASSDALTESWKTMKSFIESIYGKITDETQ